MKKNTWLSLLGWWFAFSSIWGLFRLLQPQEVVSELIAKPIIWLGITALFFQLKLIPYQVIDHLKHFYLTKRPVGTTFIAPLLFTLLYFLTINFRIIKIPLFTPELVGLAILINFATGIVEEITYRGVLYVWLLQTKNEFLAFILVQLLFLLGHIPTLLINSDNLATGLTHAFFIILLGSVHTLIFRLTKSLYASSLSHGLWNTLVYLLLL